MTLLGPPPITQAERVWNRLWDVLYAPTHQHQVYVYQLTPDGLPVGSYIWRGPATPELPEILRDEFRGGDFRVLIRKKRQMVFGGNISVSAPRKESRCAAAPAIC